MSEMFCLKWNDFHTNVSNSFGVLRNEDYLQDVTIVTDDHEQVAAHKLVLSACSEYFKNIFKRNKSPNLLLCIEGVNSADLGSVLDYIYNGEVQILQENLDRFLEVAQRFKLDGLQLKKEEEDFKESNVEVHDRGLQQTEHDHPVQENRRQPNPFTRSIAIVPNNMDRTEADQRVFEHMEKFDGQFFCKICGKSTGHRSDMKKHVETHLDGLSFNCQHCGKVFRSRNTLSQHIHKHHKSSY